MIAPYPKIELHVHLEGTVRAPTLLEIARRNDYPLPADTAEGLASLYEFTDFRHFIEVWILTTNALQREADFRQMVVDYAAEAAAHGAVLKLRAAGVDIAQFRRTLETLIQAMDPATAPQRTPQGSLPDSPGITRSE